ncbi:uncharacterized protein LOC119399159 [Rhipicephalus sanguineus]|uniref:uncharacterized protein LOC119399159 n=1 Tax=Rhipicephalus sanguineus TaxID=34632 RepID=UPI001893B481|nr:uncharacterized protein LOC119399159 [Rhipicephalus sanguineus]
MDCAGDRANTTRQDAAVQPAHGGEGDRCTDDGTCTCGKPVKPLMKRVIACALVMLVSTTVLNHMVDFTHYSVTTLVALALPEMMDEDVYDEWSELEAEVSPQSSLITPPTLLTNATCLAFEDGLPGNESDFKSLLVRLVLLLTELVSASLVMAVRNRVLPSYERLHELATSLL